MAKPAAPPGAVDLSMLVDVARDSVDKAWTREGTSLVSPAGVERARLQVPHIPPEEYELTLIVQKRGTAATGGVHVGLVAGGAQFTVAIDVVDGQTVGIGTLDGKTADANESTVRNSKVFTDDKPKVLVFQVRKDGIAMTCDARPVLSWKGAYHRCGVHPVNVVPNPQALFLVSRNAELAFSRMTLVPLRN